MEELDGNGYYPVALRVSGMRCVIVGGGPVAERKLKGLVQAGANRIDVISPVATEGIQSFVESGKARWIRRAFEQNDYCEAWLIIAATDNAPLNEEIAEQSKQRQILCNRADYSDGGSFLTASTVRRGDLLVSVTTSGASPALARKLGQELESYIDKAYGEAVADLRALRTVVLEQVEDRKLRREILQLAAQEILEEQNAGGDAQRWFFHLLKRLKGRND
ncbi:bifunctional precorrin-2 dehydrogenase/sirohydrochlorin ferrochelatase [Paenibacillus sp. HB172176]|uniref:precorrin-2 dehydrogenase/sirohydrochlorin ferrochelatase family protein n=1 Tax=Paenibacillus sp. HB172176 TaxID=2493690 RepID=UPI00143ADA32|nr:bifunctional precorrin-2 dehydrogenase/sirohydrochlorin ferrochelatase [Paenibacillus sp. HB172176]